MRSPAAAIAWELRHRHRWGLATLTLYLAVLAAIKLLVVGPGQSVIFADEFSFGLLVIVPLGRQAAGYLLASDASMASMRGRVHAFGRRKLVPTYHPAYLLRSPHMKKDCWQDIQLAMRELSTRPNRG